MRVYIYVIGTSKVIEACKIKKVNIDNMNIVQCAQLIRFWDMCHACLFISCKINRKTIGISYTARKILNFYFYVNGAP